MSRRRTRCLFTVSGSGGDRCRRYSGHVGSDQPHADWHLPDCGSAVNARVGGSDQWITSSVWVDMFHDVQRADGIVRSLRIEMTGDDA